MPWVLGHEMSTDYFSKFAIRNKDMCRSSNPADIDPSTPHGQWVIFKLAYKYLGFGRPGKQHGVDSQGRGPKQVFYVHEVHYEVPPVLRYGVDGCPTKRQLQTLRRFHGRREMWWPMAGSLPRGCPIRARLPRPVVYEDEVPCPADPSPSDREAHTSGIEGGMQMLCIEEEAEEEEASLAGPRADAVSSFRKQWMVRSMLAPQD